MAKKDKKDRGRSDSVRAAVDQAFQAGAEQAETARTRAQDIVDELTQAAGRVREVLDELRPPTGDDLNGIRDQLDALERRVAALESKQTRASTTSAVSRARSASASRAKTASRAKAKPKASQAKASETKTGSATAAKKPPKSAS